MSNRSPYDYSRGVPFQGATTHTNTTAPGVAAERMAANTSGNRVFIEIQNISETAAEFVHFAFGETATTSHPKIAAGQSWANPPHWCPQGALSLISASGTPSVAILHSDADD